MKFGSPANSAQLQSLATLQENHTSKPNLDYSSAACVVLPTMSNYQSPAKLLRAVKRMTKFIERKKLKTQTILSKCVLPSIDIPPVLPILSIVCVQRTTVPSQVQVKPLLSFSKTILTHFIPENYPEVHFQTSQNFGEYNQEPT